MSAIEKHSDLFLKTVTSMQQARPVGRRQARPPAKYLDAAPDYGISSSASQCLPPVPHFTESHIAAGVTYTEMDMGVGGVGDADSSSRRQRKRPREDPEPPKAWKFNVSRNDTRSSSTDANGSSGNNMDMDDAAAGFLYNMSQPLSTAVTALSGAIHGNSSSSSSSAIASVTKTSSSSDIADYARALHNAVKVQTTSGKSVRETLEALERVKKDFKDKENLKKKETEELGLKSS